MSMQWVIRGGIVTALTASLLFLAFNVLRLTTIFNITHSFLILNMLALAAIASVGLWNWRRLQITWLEWGMVAALIASTMMADYANRLPIDIAIDIVRPLLFLAVIITLRHCLDGQWFSTSETVHKLLAYIIGATVIGVMTCTLVDRFIQPIYPAYSSIDAALGLGWLMATSGPAAPLLFLILLVVSGKRAVYLASGIAMLMVYRKQPKMLVAVLAILIAASSVSMLTARFYASQSQPQSNAGAQDQSHTEAQITEYYSGGRLDEIRDAVAAVPGPAYYIVGMGPGFAYPSKTFGPEGTLHRNLHFTPLSLIIYYGVIFSALFAYYILRLLPAAWRALNDRANPVRMTYAIYFFASLPFALTEFSVFGYANFAIACGLIAATDRTQYTTD